MTVDDLVRVATLEPPYGQWSTSATRILAEQAAAELTPAQYTRAMVMVALIARAFASRLPADVYQDVLLDLQDALSDGPEALAAAVERVKL